ncbi:MAG: aminopeptidase P N-terminal domain-containing protein [Armatimonadota bacterium]|nr:aminopeptidase P N-terminal domain-containing protein [Armatimonadota bacterium]
MRPVLCLAVLLAVTPALAQYDFPVYETDKLPAVEYAPRREAIRQKMVAGSIAFFFTNETMVRNNDVDFQFRGDSNFLYLTGFEEPDAVLVMAPAAFKVGDKMVKEVLFTNVADQGSITWLGYRMGPENVVKMLGIEHALSNREFAGSLPGMVEGKTAVYVSNAPAGGRDTLNTMNRAVSGWLASGNITPSREASGWLSTMRRIKSPAEIVLLKRASDISARAHVEAMKTVRPGMREYEIGALVEYFFKKEGCEFVGYPPIVGAGENSTILHYQSLRKQMKAGEIICMDAAGEYHGYSSDVTRSFPVSGKFSAEQKAIYEVVLKAQEAGIAKCRSGVSVGAVGAACSDELAKGMIALGIIKAPNELGRYYMHGFGHGIGLDVHDPMPGTLAPGATLTVEPGIYIKAGSPCDPKWWNIGIRIEDAILVTDGDPVNMSIACPRTVAEIERIMAR